MTFLDANAGQTYRTFCQIICSPVPDVDYEKRKEIQALLRLEIKKLQRGESGACTNFRNVIGRDCGFGFPGQIDLSKGYQDATDLYRRLMSVYSYDNLMGYHVVNQYGLIKAGKFENVCVTDSAFPSKTLHNHRDSPLVWTILRRKWHSRNDTNTKQHVVCLESEKCDKT